MCVVCIPDKAPGTASCFQTPHRKWCANLPLGVHFRSDPHFRPQPLWIHTVASFASVTPLESTLTKSSETVSKHATSNPVESTVTERRLVSSLDSALTKKGVGGGGWGPGQGSGLQMPGQKEDARLKPITSNRSRAVFASPGSCRDQSPITVNVLPLRPHPPLSPAPPLTGCIMIERPELCRN